MAYLDTLIDLVDTVAMERDYADHSDPDTMPSADDVAEMLEWAGDAKAPFTGHVHTWTHSDVYCDGCGAYYADVLVTK
jgi:hypothetical protein